MKLMKKEKVIKLQWTAKKYDYFFFFFLRRNKSSFIIKGNILIKVMQLSTSPRYKNEYGDVFIYMYKYTLLDIKRFKAVMAGHEPIRISQLIACFCNNYTGISVFFGSLVQKVKSKQYCIIKGGSLQVINNNIIESLELLQYNVYLF